MTNSTQSKVTVASDASKLSFVLHPLPLLNISDFYVRAKNTSQKHFIGALLGTRSDREVVIENAFELKLTDNDDTPTLDQEYLKNKIELYKTTFPSHEPLGWFHVRPEMTSLQPNDQSLAIHEHIMTVFDMPVMMLFDPSSHQSGSSQLPVKAFELLFKEKTVDFSEISVRVETGDAERIGVEDITKGSNQSGGRGQDLEAHLTTETNAIKMFYSRLKVLRDYVTAVKKGEIAANHEILRQIDSFMARLSDNSSSNSNLQRLLDEQQLSVLSSALLAVVTKAEHANMDMAAKRQIILNSNSTASMSSKSSTAKETANPDLKKKSLKRATLH